MARKRRHRVGNAWSPSNCALLSPAGWEGQGRAIKRGGPDPNKTKDEEEWSAMEPLSPCWCSHEPALPLIGPRP